MSDDSSAPTPISFHGKMYAYMCSVCGRLVTGEEKLRKHKVYVRRETTPNRPGIRYPPGLCDDAELIPATAGRAKGLFPHLKERVTLDQRIATYKKFKDTYDYNPEWKRIAESWIAAKEQQDRQVEEPQSLKRSRDEDEVASDSDEKNLFVMRLSIISPDSMTRQTCYSDDCLLMEQVESYISSSRSKVLKSLFREYNEMLFKVVVVHNKDVVVIAVNLDKEAEVINELHVVNLTQNDLFISNTTMIVVPCERMIIRPLGSSPNQSVVPTTVAFVANASTNVTITF